MQLGLALSFLMHAALLAWALFTMHRTPELPDNLPEPIAVSMITASELDSLKKGDVNSTELEAKAKDTEPKPDISNKEAEKPKPLTAPEPPAAAPPPEPPKPEPAKEEPKADPIAEKLAALPPEPAPGPTPEELKRIEDEKKAAEEAKKKAEDEAKKKAEDEKKKKDEEEKKKKAEEEKRKKKLAEEKERKKKEDEAKKKSEADRLSALLDKDPTKRGAPQSSSDPSKPTDYTGPTAGADRGDAPVLSVTQQRLLLAQINRALEPCSKMPGGGGGIDTPVVIVRWNVNPDGSMATEPEILNPQSTPLFQIAAEASLNAVRKCSPLQLPPDMYQYWKTIKWEFDWPKILGLR